MARINYVWFFFFPPVPLGWRSPWGFSHVQQGQLQWPLDDGDLSSGFSDSLELQQAIGSVYSGVVLNTHWWSTGPNIKDFVVAWNIGRTIKNHNQKVQTEPDKCYKFLPLFPGCWAYIHPFLSNNCCRLDDCRFCRFTRIHLFPAWYRVRYFLFMLKRWEKKTKKERPRF